MIGSGRRGEPQGLQRNAGGQREGCGEREQKNKKRGERVLRTTELTCFLHCLQPSSQRRFPFIIVASSQEGLLSPWIDGERLLISMAGARQ